MDEQRDKLLESTYVLAELHKLGIIKAYKERKNAFAVLRDYLEQEKEEIFLVGTSLRGLLHPDIGDRIFQEILKRKFAESKEENSHLRIKILLTHPAFAYLRQNLEKLYSRKEDFSIAQEIYEAVLQLKKLGAQANNIQFVKGTPTCFAVKTSKMMFINPYPYQDQALGSFSLVISNEPNRDDIYRSFERNHFIWDSPNTELLNSFTVQEMENIFHKSHEKLIPQPPQVRVKETDFSGAHQEKEIQANIN